MHLWVCKPGRQTGKTGVQSHDPALTWMKEMVTLLETKQGKGESEGLAGQPLTMGPCSKTSKTVGHTKARETPSFPLPHCNRAGISHWPVNSHSIKLLFNLTPGLHRNQEETGGMYLGNWPHWPYSEPATSQKSFSLLSLLQLVLYSFRYLNERCKLFCCYCSRFLWIFLKSM